MSTKTIYLTNQAQAEKLVALQLGKVKLPVASVTAMFQKESAVGKIEGYRGSILINFKAYDPRNKSRIADAFENGELDEADIATMTFAHEILVTDRNPNPAIPCKGDMIEANIAFAEKNGEKVLDIAGNPIMSITSYQVPVAKELKAGGLFSKKAESTDTGIDVAVNTTVKSEAF